MNGAKDIKRDLSRLAALLIEDPFCQEHCLDRMPLNQVDRFVKIQTPQEADTRFSTFKTLWARFVLEIESLMLPGEEMSDTVTIQDYVYGSAADEGADPTQVTEITAVNEDISEQTIMGNIVNFVSEEAPVDWSVPDSGDLGPPGPSLPAEEAPGLPVSQVSREFYSLGEYFKAQRRADYGSISPTQLNRLEAQQILYAIESEFQDQLGERARLLWPHRASSAEKFLDKRSLKTELHPSLVEHWENGCKLSDFWPAEDALPLITLKNTLKLLSLAADDASVLHSPLESAMWIFLFGQEAQVGEVHVTNILGLPALDLASFTDIFLRLCRVQRLKTMLANPMNLVTESECAELRSHASQLFRFSRIWGGGV